MSRSLSDFTQHSVSPLATKDGYHSSLDNDELETAPGYNPVVFSLDPDNMMAEMYGEFDELNN